MIEWDYQSTKGYSHVVLDNPQLFFQILIFEIEHLPLEKHFYEFFSVSPLGKKLRCKSPANFI